MASQLSVAIWLSVNYEECQGSRTSINEIYDRCKGLTPQPSKEVIGKCITRLFKVEPKRALVNGEHIIVYNSICSRNALSDPHSDKVTIPPFCEVITETDPEILTVMCPLTIRRNDQLLASKISLKANDTEVDIAGQLTKLGYSLPHNQNTINGLIHAIQCVRICKGAPMQEKLPKTFTKETLSELHNSSAVVIARSKSCKTLMPFCGKALSCKTCTDSLNQFNRRLSITHSDENNDSSVPATKKARIPLSDTTNTFCSNINTTHIEPEPIQPSLELNAESHTDMRQILDTVLKDFPVPEFRILLESQLRNCDSELDIHRRRWDPKVISICLSLVLRSPRAYNDLKDSGMLLLPSQRLLRYYKNIVKQKPDFNQDNLEWMKNEASRKNVSAFGLRGGLLIDEMTIQDDLVITKKGDKWDIIGMTDMGSTNNAIKLITTGKKKVEMATHALQFVFHGFTGFRWPVVYFGSSTATAHELYTTFWQCVDKLDERGFTVDYVMLDGASTNRSFTNMLMKTPRDVKFMFHDVFDCSHSICAIQDIMHCLKKVRNNIESSKSENSKQKGRYLILNDTPVLWDHWVDCFNFNFQNGFSIHRKLTDEHINLTPASKMRNHLAVQVLDKDMLYLMKMYQATLATPETLSSSISILERTSELVHIFTDKNRPISSTSDERMDTLRAGLTFFNTWESEIKSSEKYAEKKNLMTSQTREDINCSISGFISLINIHVKNGNSINPGFMNSDLVENFFCQQRGIRNGLNTNPTLAQYGPAKNAIILGQTSVSNKANSGTSAHMFNAHKPCPLNPNRNKDNKAKRRTIRL